MSSVCGARSVLHARALFGSCSESVVLSGVGAGIALTFAHWGSRLLVGQLSTWAYAAVLDLSPDWRVLAVTAAMTVTTALLFGTLPAYRAASVEPIEALKLQPRGLAGGTGAFGGAIIIVQVALSLLLIVGAGRFLRSFAALAYRDLGFDRSRVLVAVVEARRSAVPVASRADLYGRVQEAVARVPGVESVATSMATPLGSAGVRFTPDITVAGNAVFAGREVRILTNPVSPDWFRTFGTRILAGRDFDARADVRETLACLLALDVPVRFIQGNCEVAVLEAMAGRDHPAVPEQHRPIIRWMAQHLQFEYGRLLASWPKTLRLDIEGCGQVLFCHAVPAPKVETIRSLGEVTNEIVGMIASQKRP